MEKDKEIMWLREQLEKCQDNLAAALGSDHGQPSHTLHKAKKKEVHSE